VRLPQGPPPQGQKVSAWTPPPPLTLLSRGKRYQSLG
jgi:hypothetical protein